MSAATAAVRIATPFGRPVEPEVKSTYARSPRCVGIADAFDGFIGSTTRSGLASSRICWRRSFGRAGSSGRYAAPMCRIASSVAMVSVPRDASKATMLFAPMPRARSTAACASMRARKLGVRQRFAAGDARHACAGLREQAIEQMRGHRLLHVVSRFTPKRSAIAKRGESKARYMSSAAPSSGLPRRTRVAFTSLRKSRQLSGPS